MNKEDIFLFFLYSDIIYLVIYMKFKYNNKDYEIIIEKKNNKNTYIRVTQDLKIYVTTNYLTSTKSILKLINDNESSIIKMINIREKKNEKESNFYLLGKEYDLVKCNIMNKINISDNKIYYKTESSLNKYIRDLAYQIYTERLDYWMNIIKGIPYPILNIKKMTRKWGYCNKSKKLICLNLNLIKYSIDEIDYVIVHELCHFIHFDHSKKFWECVSEYKPNYKINRKVLNEE